MSFEGEGTAEKFTETIKCFVEAEFNECWMTCIIWVYHIIVHLLNRSSLPVSQSCKRTKQNCIIYKGIPIKAIS